MAEMEQQARIHANDLREQRLSAGMRFGVLVPLSTLAAAILAMILGRSPDGIILGGLAVLVPVVNAILRRISSNGSSGSNGTS